MYRKFIKLVSVLLISIIVLGGCGKNKNLDSKTSINNAGSDKKFTIVTSFYPMYIATINVTKGVSDVEVINMTKPQTGCLHDYQLSPEDLKTLEKANVFVINGAGMEAFMDKVISQQRNLKIIEASKGIDLIKDENGEMNPHVWTSVTNEIHQVENIAEQLAALDIKNAPKYKSNAEVYIKKLENLRSSMHKALSNIQNKNIITFHEAFPYFAQEFGLHIVAVIEREPGTAPSPKELEDTIKIVRNSKTKALFAEPQYSAKAADTIANETGAKVFTLDPIVTGDAKSDAYDEYIHAMEQNIKSLQEALK